MTTLRGLTWAHSRGFTPLAAAAEAWHDLHPDVEVIWRKRSLWGFGEGPLTEAAREFDLIVFDHPHTGAAARDGLLLPVDDLVDAQAKWAGPSRESYGYGGRLWGLPVDAACQSAACRPDLLEQLGEPLPETWDEVLALARRTGRVSAAFTPMGALGMFHSLLAGFGAPAARSAGHYAERAPATEALAQLRQLFELCGPDSLEQSPVRLLGEMATTGGTVYTPLVYCYSNYSREGYCPHRVHFSKPPVHPEGAGATLGGAGLGISAFTAHRDACFDFARWLISSDCQGGLYLHAQGQPALRAVWTSDDANRLTQGFFTCLLPVIDRAYRRPNYPGYGEFQSRAGRIVQSFLKGDTALPDVLDAISGEHLSSRPELFS